MRGTDAARSVGFANWIWTIRFMVLGTLVMMGILAMFYATDHKPLAMRLMRAVNPLAAPLAWLTQNMRLNTFNARLYDFLVVVAMAIQSSALGFAIDWIHHIQRKRSRES